MTTHHAAGMAGESRCEAYLCGRGMTTLARRFRGADGEIDLIMEDGGTVVFVEVKARPGGARGSGLLAVTPAKQRRIAHAAMTFLMQREWTERSVRFDVVELTAAGILHVPNAFQPGAWIG